MTDKELLELAAMAAGIKGDFRDSGEFWWQYGVPLPKTMSHEPTQYWNPLTDDDDALRLAVKLKMTVRLYPQAADIYVHWSDSAATITEPYYDDDPYVATRRAIVRAAAEIGKEMK